MIKQTRLLTVAFGLTITAFTTSAQAALVVPAGLSPGDTYHVMFVTSDELYATSTNIADYDAFVQGVADGAGIGDSISWRVVGSTSNVSAIDHIAPLFPDPNVPTYNQNGELLAVDWNQLWSALLYDLTPVMYDEHGGALLTAVWTGSDPFGNALPGEELGGVSGMTAYGFTDFWDYCWLSCLSDYNDVYYASLYAMSEQLVVPTPTPVPAAVWLFGSGFIGLIGIARRKKA